MSSQIIALSAYYEFPQAARPPLWRRSVCVLSVLGVHLGGLVLAFGALLRPTLPETLPALTVRVLAATPLPPRVAAPEPARAEPPRKPAPPSAAPRPPTPAKKASPVAAPVLAAPATASAPTAFAVAPPAAAPAAVAAPPPALVGARFDADYLHNPKPVYPAASRRLGEEGRVLLRVRVSAQGLPLSVDVRQSSGSPRLDEAARAAVERWRFVPAKQGTEAVESTVVVPLQFTLDS
ncbi:MAG: energy transducer TonB [Burkholderiales bacterium]|nr:energy transducer TonB [Burkholderiales bacterium]